METKRRVILKRRDGMFMNLFFEPVRTVSQAARFNDLESFHSFLHGVYAPSDPSLYYPQMIEITYREVDDLERPEK